MLLIGRGSFDFVWPASLLRCRPHVDRFQMPCRGRLLRGGWMQIALRLEPVFEKLWPSVGGKVLLVHAEAVAALYKDMKFHGNAGAVP